MKASIIAVAAGFAASLVSAQLDQIPQCALSCAISSLGSTGCGSTDIKCICEAAGFITALQPCVEKSCSAADLAKTIQAATGLCASAGVSLSIPAAGPTSTASADSSASSAASSVLSSASESASSVSSVISSVVSSISSVYGNATVTTSGPKPTNNSTVTTGQPTPTGTNTNAPTPTGNAAGRNSVALGGAAVLAFAAAALL